MNNNLVVYYEERANEYDKIYEKPERQSDLLALTEILQRTFTDKDVTELACGTGYWTQKIAKVAKSVNASDINEAVVDIAKDKEYEKNNVTFEVADMFNYSLTPADSLFSGFIWSHIKKQELDKFIDIIHSFVKPGGMVVFIGNNFVEGSNRPVVKVDEYGNTYQDRILENGSKYSIIKNFPTDQLFFKLLKEKGERIKFVSLKYYWVVCYQRK